MLMNIDDIKNGLNIIELARREGLDLIKQSDKLYKAKCCFHTETNASLAFYPHTNTYKCFGCGAGGDVINFYAKRHNLSNSQAVKELAGGLTRPKFKKVLSHHKKGSDNKPPSGVKSKSGKDQARRIFGALRDFCGELDPVVLSYLKGRGLTEKTIKKFGIFSIKDYKRTREFLISQFPKVDLKKLGLLSAKNKFLFIKNKIMIPVTESGGIVILRGRYFDNGETEPVNQFHSKYVSTPGIAGRFFNEDILKAAAAGEKIFLCEGEFDTMLLIQRGLKAIGLLGVNNYNSDMIQRLKNFQLVTILDNDNAGDMATKKICDLFYNFSGKAAISEIGLKKAGVKDVTEYYQRGKHEQKKG